MKTLTSLPLFALLRENAQGRTVTDAVLDAAYDGFVLSLFSLSQSESPLPQQMRVLCYTRLELTALQKQIPYTCEAGKKCGHRLRQGNRNDPM